MQCLDSIAVRSRLLTLFQSFGIKHSLRLDNTISDTMNDIYSSSSKKSHVNSENRMNVNYSVSDIITATSTSTSTSAANTISHPSSKNSSFTSKKVHPIDNNTYMNNNDEDLGDSVVIHSYSANVVVAEAKVSVGSSYTIDTSSPIISANTSSATTKEKSIISAIKSNSNNYSHKINYMKSNSGGNVSERKTTSSSKKRKMRVSVDGNSNEYECDYIDNIFGNL